MITKILDMLSAEDYYNVSTRVEQAKGKYELVGTWAGFKRQFKRIAKWRRKLL